MINKKEIKNYLKKAGKNCPPEFRKKLIKELENNISDYIEENPQSATEDILKHFGEPEKFACEYILSMDENDIKKSVLKSKWIKRSVITGISLLILIAVITSAWIIHDNSKSAGVYFKETIIEYVEEDTAI